MKTPFSVKKPATIKNNFAAELPDIWRSWQNFIVGKNRTPALEFFHFNLEKNLLELQSDIESGCYRHGGYQKFVIYDKKRREIRVASVRDRVVHRLLYDFLVKLYDRTFIFDLWSCRKSKGVTAAIERTQEFLRRNPRAYVWRADIKKFFDNIDHRILMSILQRKVKDQKLLQLLLEVIGRDRGRIGQLLSKGISIGNLTSQIFANIYLNDFDYFVKHELKVKYYLRYGDDFIIIAPDAEVLNRQRLRAKKFLQGNLKLKINSGNETIVRAKIGLNFLGVKVFPRGRRLSKRTWRQINEHLELKNCSSCWGLVQKHSELKKIELFGWQTFSTFRRFFWSQLIF